ncbi:MAG: hypothetical protein NC548_50660 [Lachnospiraceae bacterium]|nr:hypothetical protein [Lachnospiraceae bacterium]
MDIVMVEIGMIDTKGFVVTIKSNEIDALWRAQKRYGVKIPDIQFILFEMEKSGFVFMEMEGHDGDIKSTFSIDKLKKNLGNKDIEDTLKDIIDNIRWGDVIEEYLMEQGINYEA